jgi:hypothetical protein
VQKYIYIPFLLIVAMTFGLYVDSSDLDLSTVCRSTYKNKSLGQAGSKKNLG